MHLMLLDYKFKYGINMKCSKMKQKCYTLLIAEVVGGKLVH